MGACVKGLSVEGNDEEMTAMKQTKNATDQDTGSQVLTLSARSQATQDAIDAMKELEGIQDSPMVGIFWYDPGSDELFGVHSQISEGLLFMVSDLVDFGFRTGARTHRAIWKKELRRGKDSRFGGDCESFPRGRVVEIKDGGYKVYVGNWFDENSSAKKLILDEFQLPEDSTEFVKNDQLIDLVEEVPFSNKG